MVRAITSSGADGAHPHATKRDDIDGLRALAVCLVLLVHSFPQYMPKGFIGVDIFFVISGFLITGILVRELHEGRFSLWSFYTRRVNRIFPALILVLVACVGFGWLALYADEFKLLGRSVAAGSGFAANSNFFLETGYWDVASKLKPLLHLWSLGVEEQFYLAWPLLLWAAWMLGLNIAIVLAALVTGSLAWNLWVKRMINWSVGPSMAFKKYRFSIRCLFFAMIVSAMSREKAP
jgi:peptidoglycan/LPS O-acetylase OafA/YrhL